MVYQIGLLFTGIFTLWTAVAIALFALLAYMTVRKNPYQ